MKNRRVALVLDQDTEDQILALRAQKEFQRCTYSELIRRLIRKGLEESKK